MLGTVEISRVFPVTIYRHKIKFGNKNISTEQLKKVCLTEEFKDLADIIRWCTIYRSLPYSMHYVEWDTKGLNTPLTATYKPNWASGAW